MSIPFEEILKQLSPERQKQIEERAKELIEEQSKIEDCIHLIDASGGATELAEFYHVVQGIGTHHKLPTGSFLAAIRNAIILQAGLSDDHTKGDIFLSALETYKAD